MKLRPKHSFESVIDELAQGLSSGMISISQEIGESPSRLKSFPDEFSVFLSYPMHCVESNEEFIREVQGALRDARHRIWICGASLSGMRANLERFSIQGRHVDTRIIVPSDAPEEELMFPALLHLHGDWGNDNEMLRVTKSPVHFLLMIIDNVAYFRVQDVAVPNHMKLESKFRKSILCKIDEQQLPSLKMCERLFTELWKDTVVSKTGRRSLED
jgi:hypothetical protein